MHYKSGNDEIIKLKYDDPLLKLSDDEIVVYGILFWASALGLDQIVSYIIKLGYSPFTKSFDE